jgi:SGNH domain (fused to AT3 domains)
MCMTTVRNRHRQFKVVVSRAFRSSAGIIAVAVLALSACATPGVPDLSEKSSANPPGAADASAQAQPAAAEEPTYATAAQVLESVKAAEGLQSLPDSLAAGLVKTDPISLNDSFHCYAVDNPSDAEHFGECAYGDPDSHKLMVVYGDSRSDMWAPALQGVAKNNGWGLRVFAKHGCPAPDLPFISETNAPNEKCDVYHATAPAAIKALNPDLVIVTSISWWKLADGSVPTPSQWQDGWVAALNKLSQPGTPLAMLGDLPMWLNNGPRCLAAHIKAVQECSVPVSGILPGYQDAEQAAASAAGTLYIRTVPWICADRCEPVVADTRVFNDDSHLTQSYAISLTGALGEALQPVMT